MAFDPKERGKEAATCRACAKDFNSHKADTAQRLKGRLTRNHKKRRTTTEWQDAETYHTTRLENASLNVSDEKAGSIVDVEAALHQILKGYGGVLNMAEKIAVDLFSERVPLNQRLKHHRLVLSLLNAKARQNAAMRSERARVRMAKAMSASSDDMLDSMAGDNRAMHEAAEPHIAQSKHGVLHMVLEWCLVNRLIHPRDIPVNPRQLYDRRRAPKGDA